MRTTTAAAICLAGFALLAATSCDASSRAMLTTLPACSATTEPGTPCTGTVNGVAGTKCLQPIQPASTQCPAGLLQLLAQIVNVASAAPADTCAMTPCCDVTGQTTECATVAVGCIADLKLCVGGGVGTLLKDLVPNLDLQLLTGSLPISASPLPALG